MGKDHVIAQVLSSRASYMYNVHLLEWSAKVQLQKQCRTVGVAQSTCSYGIAFYEVLA
jgi:hypothetical protein